MGTSGKVEEALLESRLTDAARLSEERCFAHFVGFLDERQALVAEKCMKKQGFKNYMLWGGYDGSERVVFGAFPDFIAPDPEEYPVIPVTVQYRTCDVLTHRDFLGALMAEGIKRETIGDILVGEGRCVMFVREEIVEYLLSGVQKIGRVGVRLSRGYEGSLPEGRKFSEFSSVIASARLDCAVAAALGTSREKASGYISAGLVMLNHEEAFSCSAEIKDGDKLSVRGKGRFLLDQVGPPTKKGRLKLSGRKYI